MDNYICINGKKTELTKEQLRQLEIIIMLAESVEEEKRIEEILRR